MPGDGSIHMATYPVSSDHKRKHLIYHLKMYCAVFKQNYKFIYFSITGKIFTVIVYLLIQ